MNRVHELQGIVMDIIYDRSDEDKGIIRVHKIKVKCTGICNDDSAHSDHLPKIIESLSRMFQNTIHTLNVGINNASDQYELFGSIKYKVCYLTRDVRKIRPFI
jgi:hypothetical protein